MILLSPSKDMHQTVSFSGQIDSLDKRSRKLSEALSEGLRALNENELQNYYGISSSLTQEVLAWLVSPPVTPIPAGLMYQGEAYKSLAWESLNTKVQEASRNGLTILSALYGPVGPFTGLYPYRLDLTLPLPKDIRKDQGVRSLKGLWIPIVRELLTERIQVQGLTHLISACSGEFQGLLEPFDSWPVPLITTEFLQKDMVLGGLKKISTRIKQARGFFVRWALECIASTSSEKNGRDMLMRKLKGFSLNGYKFSSSLSTDWSWTFVQEERS